MKGVTMLVEGAARGPVVALSGPLSFWGGFDAASGRVIDRSHPDLGRSLAGCVLVMERARGSSTGASVLAEAIRLGTAPVAIVMRTRDPIVMLGAMVANDLYGARVPVVEVTDDAAWARLVDAATLELDADGVREPVA